MDALPRFVKVVGGAVARDVAEHVVVVVPEDGVGVLARRLRQTTVKRK